MKKAISALVLAAMLLPLAACRAAEEVDVVPTDTERIVQMALASDNNPPAAEKMPQAPAMEYAEEHYTFSATAAEGRLNIAADARVRYPASLRLPIARVSAVGFTQEQASAYFAYFFAGEQPIVVENYGAAKETKQSLRDKIALYEGYIAAGTSMEMTLLYEDELRVEIERLEARIPAAPDTAPPDVISDGTMLPGEWGHYDDVEPTLELNVRTEREHLHMYTPVHADEHSEGHFYYNTRDYPFSMPGSTVTELAPNASIDRLNTTWDEAMRLCDEFFTLAELEDVALGKACMIESEGNCGYLFYFVRTVAGVPVALNFESTDYKGTKTPWGYESISMIIYDDGICSIGWASPTKTTEIVNAAADAVPFAQAAEIFETMAVEVYEPKTVFEEHERNIAVRVDKIELSLLRVRDIGTDERTGLYVPAWVFYGQSMTDGDPNVNWEDQIVFAINAVDGSVIDMKKGY